MVGVKGERLTLKESDADGVTDGRDADGLGGEEGVDGERIAG